MLKQDPKDDREMRVLLISANTERINLPTMPLGLGYVAAATRRAGHEVTFLDLMVEEDPGTVVSEIMERFRPEIIGISVRNIDDQKMEGTRFLLGPIKAVIARCRTLTGASVGFTWLTIRSIFRRRMPQGALPCNHGEGAGHYLALHPLSLEDGREVG
jgi:hypothetical protein